MRSLPDDNLSYPVLLETPNGSGSGFYFRTDKKIFLVTALHVLYQKENNTWSLNSDDLKLTSYDKFPNISEAIEFQVDLSKASIRKDDDKDIALIEMANISMDNSNIQWLDGIKKLTQKTANIVVVQPNTLKVFRDVLVSNDVFILGFPSSLGTSKQIEEKRPLLRKGVVAGINTKNKTIILDCPVYFGNSGGMAIEVEEDLPNVKYRVIGVVSQYIPFVEQLKSLELGYINLNFENSGYSVVVPIDTIIELTQEKPE